MKLNEPLLETDEAAATAPLAEVAPSHELALPAEAPPAEPHVPELPPVVQVTDLDWDAVRAAADPAAIRARMRAIVEGMETLLDRAAGPGMLFDSDRADAEDRVIRVAAVDWHAPIWAIGDLHGDLPALEAALAEIRRASAAAGVPPRVIFLGDFFDDEGFGLELLLRVYELVLEAPERVCIVAGNHDDALGFDGNRFTATVSPSDFSDFLNANRAHEWIERVGKLSVRVTARAPRALFLPDGLLVAHGGFPLADLHAKLRERGDWNDPACLNDFMWARAHPKARKKLPNRFSRGSQFGYEDFAEFCQLATELGRPVTHMLRGHDHVEERFATFPAYRTHPILTIIALSRRLPREQFGSYTRAPTVVRLVPHSLPEVHQLNIPVDVIESLFPPPVALAEEAVPEAPLL